LGLFYGKRETKHKNYTGEMSLLKCELLYLQKFDAMEQFKAEPLILFKLLQQLGRIKPKTKGLPPAIYRRQTLKVAWLIYFWLFQWQPLFIIFLPCNQWNNFCLRAR